jgi:purine-binding chemotaxis protein CheW
VRDPAGLERRSKMAEADTNKREIEDIVELEEDEDTQADKYLNFRIGTESYGISIKFVREIIELQKISEVPDMPSYVKGVINLRGKVIPIIDIRLRFNFEERKYDDRTCIIVVDIKNSSIGFIVDTVEDVLEIPENEVEPAPRFKTASGKERYISGMGKVSDSVKILLDVDKMIFEEDIPQEKV